MMHRPRMTGSVFIATASTPSSCDGRVLTLSRPMASNSCRTKCSNSVGERSINTGRLSKPATTSMLSISRYLLKSKVTSGRTGSSSYGFGEISDRSRFRQACGSTWVSTSSLNSSLPAWSVIRQGCTSRPVARSMVATCPFSATDFTTPSVSAANNSWTVRSAVCASTDAYSSWRSFSGLGTDVISSRVFTYR